MYQDDKNYLADQLRVVLSELYSLKDINLIRLESALDNMCYHFDVQTVPGDLCVARATPKFILSHEIEYKKIFEDLQS